MRKGKNGREGAKVQKREKRETNVREILLLRTSLRLGQEFGVFFIKCGDVARVAIYQIPTSAGGISKARRHPKLALKIPSFSIVAQMRSMSRKPCHPGSAVGTADWVADHCCSSMQITEMSEYVRVSP